MRIIKTIPALALVASVASVALLLAATAGAVAKNGSKHNSASELREVHHDHDHDGKHDHHHKHKDHDGKGKGKADNKCGGKKKCPTPIIEPIHHPGGGSPPGSGTGQGTGAGLGKTPGGPNLGDPGYNRPPASGSSGGSGPASPGGPSRDPVENGSGTTLKPN
jgi:hypothetical protein